MSKSFDFKNLIEQNSIKTRCLINEKDKVAFVPIFKNASTWGTEFFDTYWNLNIDRNWNQHDLSDYTFIVFLRDPYKRHLSGLCEYCLSQLNEGMIYDINNPQVIDLLLRGSHFDIHTYPQYFFIQGLNHDNTYFFDLDDSNFEWTIRYFSRKLLGPSSNFIWKKINENRLKDKGDYKIQLYSTISSIIDKNVKYKKIIEDKLAMDYHVYKNVNFSRIGN